LESVGVDGQIILKWILQKTGREGMGWINMNQDGGQVFGCLNKATNLTVQ